MNWILKCIVIGIMLFIIVCTGYTQSEFTIARLKYRGGGDWYNDPTAIPNLLTFIKKNTFIKTANDEKKLTLLSEELFSYPILFMTGHGKMVFSDDEVKRLRTFLMNGGFLYADDDYGMDEYFRAAMKKAFPEKQLVEIPFDHSIYHCHYEFSNGPPKIHEHDKGPPKAYGIFHDGRLIVYYTFNTNISDGWPESDVHGDSEYVRRTAFKMGTNIVVYSLMN